MTITLDALALLLAGVGIGIFVLIILNWLDIINDITDKKDNKNDYYHRPR